MDAVERVSDLLIAVVLIAVTLPLMVIVALAIRLDSPGRCSRSGDNGGRKAINFSSLDSVPKALPKGSTGSLQSVRFFGGRESIACRNSSMCRRQSSAPKSAVLTLPIERSAVRSSRLAFASGPALTQHTVVDRGPARLCPDSPFHATPSEPLPGFRGSAGFSAG